jgi:hypothetical protein
LHFHGLGFSGREHHPARKAEMYLKGKARGEAGRSRIERR